MKNLSKPIKDNVYKKYTKVNIKYTELERLIISIIHPSNYLSDIGRLIRNEIG